MIKLKKVSRKNPRDVEAPAKFFASAQHDERHEIDDLATAVAERCSLRRADVHGVIVALMDIIPTELLKGKIISLGKLGSFYVSVSSEGADTEPDLTEALVKGGKIQYRPTKKLRNELRMLDVSFLG